MSDQEKTRKIIADHVEDMVALQGHIEQALERQLAIAMEMPVAYAAIQRFLDMVKAQRELLKEHQQQTGSPARNQIKEAGAALFGAAAGVIDRVRAEGISRALRDDYTALNHAAMGFTMLHATATALGDPQTAAMAKRGLEAYANAIQEINHLIGQVVIEELRRNDHPIAEAAAAERNRRMVDAAWSSGASGEHPRPGVMEKARDAAESAAGA